MKILYLCPDLGVPVLGRKGASIHVRELVAAFIRAGHHVVLAAQVLNKSPWEQPALVGATLLQVRPGSQVNSVPGALKEFNEMLQVENSLPGEVRRILYNRDFAEDLRRRFDGARPDFIYERASLYGTAGIVLAGELHVPLLLEVNAPLALEQASYRSTALGDLAARAERWTAERADAVLAVSAALREHVAGLGVEGARIHVVPNGVDPLLFQPARPDPAVRARLGLKDGPLLGFVGGLRPWHGTEILPELCERLAKRRKKFQLVIVGDGPLLPSLRTQFAQRKLRRHVVFTGTLAHEEVAGVIRHFDVALAPYPVLDHAFYFSPLKLFEYMACGIAVVAAQAGQISEVLRHNKTGLLYPPGDVKALTACCERLLDEPELRTRLGRAASKWIHSRYTWDHNASRIVELARSLMRAKPNA
ncbi:MAG TPA: glycosyltransferase family 4 protein [Verrucomicrobiae bacterium]|nr:glycosyltransferase family 4 protein [Verrucomicrobiae bacterium]